jgi:hypothetical protein
MRVDFAMKRNNPENTSSSQETLFDKVYRLAKEKDEIALTKMVKEGSCISAFKGAYNPIMLLAKEGDSQSVEFLVNKFKGSRNHAVRGYAAGGHVDQVMNLLLTHGASINDAVKGYAMGGHVEQMDQLLPQGASINDAVKGYAMGGHVEQVDQLLLKKASIDDAVESYAMGGHGKQVKQLIGRGAKIETAMRGYAMGGHIEQVNQLLPQIMEDDALGYYDALGGYAIGGHVEQVIQLLEQEEEGDDASEEESNDNFIICRYAIGGHVEQVDQILKQQGQDINYPLHGYAIGGHVEQVNQLVAQIRRGIDADSVNIVVKGYEYGGYLSHQENKLRLMSFTDNEMLRESLSGQSSLEDSEDGEVEDSEVEDSEGSEDSLILNAKATKLYKIRNDYQLDFNQSQSLTITGIRVWCLQGTQLVKNGTLPAEIFLLITSFLGSTSAVIVGLTIYDANKIFDAINKNLFSGILEMNHNKFKLGFFTTEKYLEENQNAEARFKQRQEC